MENYLIGLTLIFISVVFLTGCGPDPTDTNTQPTNTNQQVTNTNFTNLTNTNQMNTTPTVDVGSDFWVHQGSNVTITATANDIDGDTLGYQWSVLSGGNPSLSDADTSAVSFSSAGLSGDIVLQLLVGDGADIASDTVTVTVLQEVIIPAENGGEFGTRVAVSETGHILCISAIQQNSVYIYSLSGSSVSLIKALTAPDVTNNIDFGNDVALSPDGNFAVIGAFEKNSGGQFRSGGAYQFFWNYGDWKKYSVLETPFPADDGYFGYAVDISDDGNRLIVSANREKVAVPGDTIRSGQIYIYDKNGSTWTYETLYPSLVQGDIRFGEDLDLSGDGSTIIVGTKFDDTPGGDNTGSAYLFKWNGSNWISSRIYHADLAALDWFGATVKASYDGNTVLIGAPNDDSATGSVYVYRYIGDTWTFIQKLNGSDTTNQNRFGDSIGVSDDGTKLLIGASQFNSGGKTYSGAVYLYELSGTNYIEKLRFHASDKTNSAYFGYGAALSGDGTTALIGSHGYGDHSGKAYIYRGF